MDEDELPPELISPVDLEHCSSCGRNFNPDIFARHKNICLKTRKKEAARKPFDMAKQRAMGTELEAFISMKKYTQTPADRVKQMAYQRQEQKKMQWKRRHAEFVETIRTAREYDVAAKKGVPLPPPEPSAPDPDYVQCPYCKRRFQEYVADRHIPFCKEQNCRLERKTTTNSTLNKRLKYRAPLPRKRNGMENVSYDTPGANIIQRKTNFSATFTVDENNDYKSAGGDPRSLGGVAMQSLPGNTPKVHKPHPPSKLAPPGVRSRMAHVKRGEKPAQQNFSEQVHHNGMTNGYSSSEHDEQDHPRHINSSPLIKRVRNVRSGQLGSREGGARNGLGLESHSDRSSNESEIPQTHSLGIGDQRRGPLQRKFPESSHSDSSLTHISAHGPKPHPSQDNTTHSDASYSGSSNNSASQRNKGLHLNAHGMSMSKFCYECGSGFPVPQAKYCCECGTKRI